MRAIDIHVHPMTKEYFDAFGKFVASNERMFKRKYVAKTEEEMADDFRRDDILGMVIAWDAQAATGEGIITNDFVAGLSRKFPDVFLPGWAMVDPWKGEISLQETERAIKELGLIGVKWQPPTQAFFPNDKRFYPFWDLLQSLGAPTLIHTGMTAIGQGEPGGGGISNKYGRPIPGIDDVAADFPNLTIVASHPAWPWTDELIATALHKGNVYVDISGWRPRYIPESLKHEMSRRLQDKIFYGSDYPGWAPGQCCDELEMEGFKPEVIDKMFTKNIIRVLDLEDSVRKALAAQQEKAPAAK